jgi:hypothetical protein
MKLSTYIIKLRVRVINTMAVRIVALAVASLILSGTVCMAQDGMIRPSKAEAQAAWDRGDYEKAFIHYNGLLLMYTRDPLYQFFTGACLVKLGRDTERAVTLLSSAINSSVNIKSVPDAVWFYYARSLQMSGSFSQAAEAYDRFTKLAGRRLAAEYNVGMYIDECKSGKGAIKPSQPSGPITGDRTNIENRPPAEVTSGVPPVRKAGNAEEKVQAAAGRDIPVAAPVKATGTGAPGRAAQEAGPGRAATENDSAAVTLSAASGRSITDASTGRTAGSAVPGNDAGTTVTRRDRPVVRGDVSSIPGENFEMLGKAVELQREADSLALLSQRTARAAREALPDQRIVLERRAANDSVRALAKKAEADSLLLALEADRHDTEEETVVFTGKEAEAPELSRFEVLQAPAYSTGSPVPVEPDMPEGLIYTIQVAAFRNNVAPSLFRGLSPVFGKKRQGSDATYYYTGLFRRLDDARTALPAARGAGFPDAFVIAMADGVQVSMERAALLEKEWGGRSLQGSKGTIPGNRSGASAPSAASQGNRTGAGTGPVNTARGERVAGTVKETDAAISGAVSDSGMQAGHDNGISEPVAAGTLSFRAEVMRISKPVKPEVIQKIETLAGTRGLDMIKNSEGETVFLIGNFITFESADEYVSLLIRNGYSAARVAAWVGMQEIPVDAARELLKRLPDD